MENIQIGDLVEVIESGCNNSNHPKYDHYTTMKKGNTGVVTAITPEYIAKNKPTTGKNKTIVIDDKAAIRERAVKLLQSKTYEIF